MNLATCISEKLDFSRTPTIKEFAREYYGDPIDFVLPIGRRSGKTSLEFEVMMNRYRQQEQARMTTRINESLREFINMPNTARTHEMMIDRLEQLQRDAIRGSRAGMIWVDE